MSGIIGGAGSKSGVIGTTELDYETGTFEWSFATIYKSGGSGTIDSSFNTGKYIKIGDQVHLSGMFKINALNCSADGFTLNIPFSASTGGEGSNQSSGIVGMSGGLPLATHSSTSTPICQISDGAAEMNLYLVRESSSWISLIPAMNVSGVSYNLSPSITYKVA